MRTKLIASALAFLEQSQEATLDIDPSLNQVASAQNQSFKGDKSVPHTETKRLKRCSSGEGSTPRVNQDDDAALLLKKALYETPSSPQSPKNSTNVLPEPRTTGLRRRKYSRWHFPRFKVESQSFKLGKSVPHTETTRIKPCSSAEGSTPGVNQDDTRKMVLQENASGFLVSDYDSMQLYPKCKFQSASPFDTFPFPQLLYRANVCTEDSRNALIFSGQSETVPQGVPQDTDIYASHLFRLSVPNTLPANPHILRPPGNYRSSRVSSCLSRSQSTPSQSRITYAKPLTKAERSRSFKLGKSVPHTETKRIKHCFPAEGSTPGVNQDDTRTIVLQENDSVFCPTHSGHTFTCSGYEGMQPNPKPTFQSIASPFAARPFPQCYTFLHHANVLSHCRNALVFFGQSETVPQGVPEDTDMYVSPFPALSVPHTLPATPHILHPPDHPRSSRVSSCLSRFHSMSSQSQITSAKPLTRAQSLPALLLKSSYEEFTPDISEYYEGLPDPSLPCRKAGSICFIPPSSPWLSLEDPPIALPRISRQFRAPPVAASPRKQRSPTVIQDPNVCPKRSRRGDAHHWTVHPESEPEVSDVMMDASVTADPLSDYKHFRSDIVEAMSVSHPMPSQGQTLGSHTSCQSIAPPVDAQGIPTVLHDSNICTEEGGTQYGLHFSMQSNSELSADCVAQVEAPIIAVRYLRKITSAKPLTRSQSLPALLLKSSYEEFTPEITADEEEETYRFQSSCPGLYQCRLTGLVFHMEGEGELLYRIVPWNTRLLVQHHKKPAGPLFDMKCVPQSVCQLHLPHCEIRSTGACRFLSVAHVKDEGIEFIRPHKVTETHVIINITGFSCLGNVKDEDSPPDPIRAQVLLFYRPPADPDPTSILNVLLLPRNVLINDVQRRRRNIIGEETYIETPPHCKLIPHHEYTLSTRPEDDSVRVQPHEAEFDSDDYDNYHPSFQVTLETRMKHIELFLRNMNDSHYVYVRQVCLSSPGVKRSCEQSSLNLPPHERLLDRRSGFIDKVSKPVIESLLDKLFEKKVLTDSERETAEEKQNRRDKARFVIDTVRNKGAAASSEMIEFLCGADPFLCEHLGLMLN